MSKKIFSFLIILLVCITFSANFIGCKKKQPAGQQTIEEETDSETSEGNESSE